MKSLPGSGFEPIQVLRIESADAAGFFCAVGLRFWICKRPGRRTRGLSRTRDRYESLYSQADRAEFFRGYEAGYNQGIKVPASKSYGQPLTAVKGKGKVTIKEGSRTVAVCSTASPNVEETKFITEQQEIVVKSRGNHGPATVQLFDTKSGKEKGHVKAYEIRGGKPAWAAGMEE